MGTSNYSDEFKRDAVHQITVRGYCRIWHRGNECQAHRPGGRAVAQAVVRTPRSI